MIYGIHYRPATSTIKFLMEKFEHTTTLQNGLMRVRQKSARSIENVAVAPHPLRKNKMDD